MIKDEFELLKHVDNEVVGIYWETEVDLAQKPDYFLTLDYLFNGLLSIHLHQNSKPSTNQQHSNFFVSTNFGNSLFLGHSPQLKNVPGSENKTLNHLVELTRPQQAENKKILLLVKHAQDLKKRFSKTYPHLKFIAIEH